MNNLNDISRHCTACGSEWPIGTNHLCATTGESPLEKAHDREFGLGSIKEVGLDPKEAVHHPAHYGGDTVYETIKVLKAWLTYDEYVGFLKGNIIKYLSRARKKNRTEREDIAKAAWYQAELAKYVKEYVR